MDSKLTKKNNDNIIFSVTFIAVLLVVIAVNFLFS